MWLSLLFPLLFFSEPQTTVETVSVQFELPRMERGQYFRPYVALWLETEDREGVRTILVWHEKSDWLKDLRQWWRKLGRHGEPPYDGVSGATRTPGRYQTTWKAVDGNHQPIAAGTYYLHLEAAREEGDREFLRQKIVLGAGRPQTYQLQGESELGRFEIQISGETDEL